MSLKINFERLMACKSRRQTRRSAGGGLFFVRSSRFYRSGRPALTCPGQFQPRHAQQVVSGRHKVAAGLGAFGSLIAAASQSTNHFDPADDFLDPFANDLTDAISRAANCAPVQIGSFDFFFTRDVRNNLPLPTALHKVFAMIVLSGSNGSS